MVRDTLTLDGQCSSTRTCRTEQGFPFTLSDGGRSLAAQVQISLNATGLVIMDITLVVDGQVVYSERPD